MTEPPGTYVDHIDPRFKDRAPHMIRDEKRGDLFVIEGMPRPIPIGLIAAAGIPAEQLAMFGAQFEKTHRGGWDPEARMADQDRDGVAAEVIYPSVGMLLCNHRDFDYKKACFDAYNRWVVEYCAPHPDRLIGLGQTAMRSVTEGIEDLQRIKEMGLRGMLPGNPQQEDYDSPIYDPFWEAAMALDLPLSFHILTSRSDEIGRARGPKLNGFLSILRGNQDIIGMLILGGVFERHPKLKIICVEADAGWVPHYMYRMDDAYKRHSHWLTAAPLSRMPSEYFRENVYLTFQDDYVAFQVAHLLNIHRLMWASDFPHSDSTWPDSQKILKEQTAILSEAERDYVVHDNVAELYHLNI